MSTGTAGTGYASVSVDRTNARPDLECKAMETVSGLVLLIAFAVAVAVLRKGAFGKRSRRKWRKGFSRRGPGRKRSRAASRNSSAARLRFPRTLAGKAYVTDGDGIRVAGQEVRLAGIDAPEWDQRARHRDGYWFNHGRRVKSALIREIGGKHVRVSVEDTDEFGRLLGTVTYKGRDIGEWLVREGHAIAAYSDRYKLVEQEARERQRGMWAHAHNFDSRAHRHRKRPTLP